MKIVVMKYLWCDFFKYKAGGGGGGGGGVKGVVVVKG